MKLSDLYQELSYGELSNLSLAGEGNGTIVEAHRPRIVAYANDALLKLYSRFVLKERSLLVELHEPLTSYQLVPRFAVSYAPEGEEDDEPIRYILDSDEDPFTGDIIKVLFVYASTGCKLPLNDENQCLSVFTPQANLLQVPYPQTAASLSLLYQARHPKLTGNLDQTIELPDVLWGSLLSFVAYKVFSHMNTQESTAKAQEHLGLFEASCAEATERDLVNSSTSTSNARFHLNGWV